MSEIKNYLEQNRLNTEQSYNTPHKQIASNLQTNTSFNLSQTYGTLDFNTHTKYGGFYRSSEFQKQSGNHQAISNLLINQNNSSITLGQPSQRDIQQFMNMMKMIKFLHFEQLQRKMTLSLKQKNVSILLQKLEQQQAQTKLNKNRIMAKQQQLIKKNQHLKKNKRVKTQQINSEIKKLSIRLRNIKKLNNPVKFHKRQQKFAQFSINERNVNNKKVSGQPKRKIYIPIEQFPHNIYSKNNFTPNYYHLPPPPYFHQINHPNQHFYPLNHQQSSNHYDYPSNKPSCASNSNLTIPNLIFQSQNNCKQPNNATSSPSTEMISSQDIYMAQKMYEHNKTQTMRRLSAKGNSQTGKRSITEQSELQNNQNFPIFLPLMHKLGEALSLKIIDEQINSKQKNKYSQQTLSNEKQINLNYFNVAVDEQQQNIDNQVRISSENKRKINSRIQSHKKLRESLTKKWVQNDKEDGDLLQLIENSIKHIQKQDNLVEQSNQKQTKSKIKNKDDGPIGGKIIQSHLGDELIWPNQSRDSMINITYQSQDKRKSEDSRDSSDKKKSSKKSDRKVNLSQSNIIIDMTASKNSSSSSDIIKNIIDHNKQGPTTKLQINQIDEVSQDLISLRNTPIDSSSKSKVETPKNSKLHLKTAPNSNQILNEPLQNPPILYKQTIKEQEDILNSIQLSGESKISRQNNQIKNKLIQILNNQNQAKSVDEEDILDDIQLLKISKASRQKQNSIRSSIAAPIMDQECDVILTSKSQINQKNKKQQINLQEQDIEQPNSYLRKFTTSSIIKKGGSAIQRINANRKNKNIGNTPSRSGGETSSITIEQEEDQDDESPVIKRGESQYRNCSQVNEPNRYSLL